jgi:hypothetical protein
VSSNVKFVIGRPIERRKMPRQISTRLRHTACASISGNPCPLARLAAIENGTAAPTSSENPG